MRDFGGGGREGAGGGGNDGLGSCLTDPSNLAIARFAIIHAFRISFVSSSTFGGNGANEL